MRRSLLGEQKFSLCFKVLEHEYAQRKLRRTNDASCAKAKWNDEHWSIEYSLCELYVVWWRMTHDSSPAGVAEYAELSQRLCALLARREQCAADDEPSKRAILSDAARVVASVRPAQQRDALLARFADADDRNVMRELVAAREKLCALIGDDGKCACCIAQSTRRSARTSTRSALRRRTPPKPR